MKEENLKKTKTLNHKSLKGKYPRIPLSSIIYHATGKYSYLKK